MSESIPEPSQNKAAETGHATQVTVAGWTAGTSVFFLAILMGTADSWPTAFGVTALAAMVAFVCYFILKSH